MRLSKRKSFPPLSGWRYQGWIARVQQGDHRTEEGDIIHGGGYNCLARLDRNRIIQSEIEGFGRRLKNLQREYGYGLGESARNNQNRHHAPNHWDKKKS